MIADIIKHQPWPGFEHVLELLLNAKLSTSKGHENHREVSIETRFYINELCRSHYDRGKDKVLYSDALSQILQSLKELGAIEGFQRMDYPDNPEYTYIDLLFDFYPDPDPTKFGIQENAPEEEAKLYMQYGGTYYLSYDQEKLQLFYDIIYKKKSFLCNLGTIKFLLNYRGRLDIESFLDWIKLDEKYIFNDLEILLFSIASSSRLNVAKMYYYLSKNKGPKYNTYFKSELAFEKEVVLDNTEHKYPDKFKEFYFDSSLETKKIHQKEKVMSGQVVYDFDTNILRIDQKNIAFKGAQKQKDFLEMLIQNSSRHVLSSETSKAGIADIKLTLDDIKKKLKNGGVSKIAIKQLFNYFEEDEIKYCRILL